MSETKKFAVKKIKFEVNDSFFHDGDRLCGLRPDAFHLKSSVGNDSSSDSDESSSNKNERVITCNELKCGMVFVNERKFNNHYQMFHVHVCCTCNKHFPSNHLLDLHIAESHDPFFELLSSKKLMYRCFVESCPEKFSTDAQRKDHTIKKHKYPSNFRFHSTQKKVSNAESKSNEIEIDQIDVQKKAKQNMVPRVICFGAGQPKAFKKPPNIRQPWHSSRNPKEQPKVGDIDMKDLMDVLN